MRSFTSVQVDTSRAGIRRARLEQYAWANRQAPTASEARLWEALRARRLGVGFRRQALLCGRFIVDFLAPAAKLVVEVDGGYHSRCGRKDARRDERLRLGGYRVLRVSAAMVHADLPRVLSAIRDAL